LWESLWVIWMDIHESTALVPKLWREGIAQSIWEHDWPKWNSPILKHHHTFLCQQFVNSVAGFMKLAVDRDIWIMKIGKWGDCSGNHFVPAEAWYET
jgi:hypothetical protein